MSKVQLHLFRHGETDWNVQKRYQGSTDIELNDLGRAQAQDLQESVLKINPEIIISSDLSRARETANIVNQNLRKAIIIDPSLRETSGGIVEGKTRDEMLNLVGADGIEKWIDISPATMDYGFPQGETKREVILRVLNFLESFALASRFTNIAVSTHGGVIKRVAHHLGPHLTNDQVQIPNCCLYSMEFDKSTQKWTFLKRVK